MCGRVPAKRCRTQMLYDDTLHVTRSFLRDMQRIVGKEVETWAGPWEEGHHYRDDLPECISLEGRELITPQQVLDAYKSFPAGTGLGWDGIHPRAILRMSPETVQAIADLLHACEATGRWPVAVELVVIVMLPKPDGAFDP